MGSSLSPEDYRELLADDDQARQSTTTSRLPTLLSFTDWDAVGSAPARSFAGRHAHKRKLYRKPVASLVPLSRTSLPNLDQYEPSYLAAAPSARGDDSVDARSESPGREQTRSPRLAPLRARVLERQRVVLNADGVATIGIEEIVQLAEVHEEQPPRSRYQLIPLPHKCVPSDELALMPCHSVAHRYAWLSGELYREPVRDRNKNWVRDELDVLLALAAAHTRAKLPMTDTTRLHKGKWKKWEAQKLHVKRHTQPFSMHAVVASSQPLPQRDQALPAEVLIRSQGIMISDTYVVVSVYGVGVFGRLYVAESDPRPGRQRQLRIEAYDPATSRSYQLSVTMSDLDTLFAETPELLVAGKKHTIIRELFSLLYFDYGPGKRDRDTEDTFAAHDNTQVLPLEEPEAVSDSEVKIEVDMQWPVLKISPEKRYNAAMRRRMEREARLRWEEEQRLRALNEFLKQPKRKRYRLLCRALRLNGHKLIVSIYHYPTQVRNFVVLGYDALSSQTFQLSVGVMEAATFARMKTLPHKWNAEQKLEVATALLPRLRLLGHRTLGPDGREVYRNALAVKEDRLGAPGPALPLNPLESDESIVLRLYNKYKRDSQASVYQALAADQRALHEQFAAKADTISKNMTECDSNKGLLLQRDAELHELIEEINGGKGMVTGDEDGGSPTPNHHEARRAHKLERKSIKERVKDLGVQMQGFKRELQVLEEQERIEMEKLRLQVDKQLVAAEDYARSQTAAARFAAHTKTRVERVWNTERDRGKRGRAWIHDNQVLLASGVSVLGQRRVRYSIFEVLSPPTSGEATKLNTRPPLSVQNAPEPLEVTAPVYEIESGDAVDDPVENGDDDEPETGLREEEPAEEAPEEADGTDNPEKQEEQGDDATPVPDQKRVADDIESDEALTARSGIVSTSAEPDGDVQAVPVPLPEDTQFQVDLYDPISARKMTVQLSRLDWIGVTKPLHEAQLKVPQLLLPASPVVQQVAALDKEYDDKREAMNKLKHLKKNVSKREQMLRELSDNRIARRQLVMETTCWDAVMRGLCERLVLRGDVLVLDRCIFETVLPIVSIGGDDDDDSASTTAKSEESVIYCHIQAFQADFQVEFHVYDAMQCRTWRIPYPDSAELVKEFAAETFLEQQMHLEAISMSLLFYRDPDTNDLQLRFED